MFHFVVVLIQKRIQNRKLDTKFIENVFLSFYTSLLIHCVSFKVNFCKLNSGFAHSCTCFHYRCAASLIMTATVPGVTRVTTGIGQNRVRPLNDLVLRSSDLLLLEAHVPVRFAFRSRLTVS